MKRIFLFFFFSCILLSSQTNAQNQAILESDEKLSPSHQAKSSFVSGGVTFYGLSTRAGYFPKKTGG
ncbi:hypothetical protein [Siphonobacter sp. SORGH_AS_0500]|uniref:hypothetical protein n=1 Tax=Siphonobacter sp. SORGH_AS_0500 TaxID=1864824 RepID=UPI002869FB74|nr:hypothetical protein [Siphonobacter sp. SORGH_AS_0500]